VSVSSAISAIEVPYEQPVPHRDEDTPLQRKKAIELQQKWGGKTCDHPALSREYDMGARTGNYCCTRCGASLTFRDKAELTQRRDANSRDPRGG
jgi:hypothetical protein